MRWLSKARAARVLAFTFLCASLSAQAVEVVTYRCEAVYQPARSVWVRSVALVHDDKKITEVRIDDVPVYSFNVHGSRVLTSQDNERITFDAGKLSWESDWRGMMQSSGRCEKAP